MNSFKEIVLRVGDTEFKVTNEGRLQVRRSPDSNFTPVVGGGGGANITARYGRDSPYGSRGYGGGTGGGGVAPYGIGFSTTSTSWVDTGLNIKSDEITQSKQDEQTKVILEKLNDVLEISKQKELVEKFDRFIKRDEEFKRKLLFTISQMHQRQELTLDGYDKIKAMADEWFGKDD